MQALADVARFAMRTACAASPTVGRCTIRLGLRLALTAGLALAMAQGTMAASKVELLGVLRATEVETPAAGMAYLSALRELAGDAEADRLRSALLARHVADLGGDATPVRRSLGAMLDAPLALEGPALARAWERVFNRQLSWQLVPVRQPPWPDDEPGAWLLSRPGAWSQTLPTAKAVRQLALVELGNRGATPLPLGRFGLDLHAGGAQWSLSCELSRPGADVLMQPLGRQTFRCLGEVPVAAAAAFDSGWDGSGDAAPRLRPRHFDRPEDVAALAAAIGAAHRPVGLVELGQVLMRAAARDAARPSPSTTRRTEIDVPGLKLAAILAACTVPLVLFGRRLQDRGASARVVALSLLAPSALVGLVLAYILFVAMSAQGNSLVLLLLPPAAFGAAIGCATVAILLTQLLALLDDEEMRWHHTIVDAVRRLFDVTGRSSRAQFWGYLAFYGAGLYVASRLPHMSYRIAAVALTLPLITLAWRRWWSMRAAERTAVLGALLLFVMELLD